jgi:hypothetical protein
MPRELGLLFQLGQDLLGWCQGFLRLVASRAGWHHVPLGATPAPRHRHHMIHGELFRRHLLAAVLTGATLQLLSPPIGLPQCTRLATLPRHMRRVLAYINPIMHAFRGLTHRARRR